MTSRARRLAGGVAAVAAVAVGLTVLAVSSGKIAAEHVIGSTSGAGAAVNGSQLEPLPAAPPRSAAPLYWGAWVANRVTGELAPWDMTALSAFEGIAGKGLSMVGFSSSFAECDPAPCVFYSFPTTPMETLRRYGAIPFFSWGVEDDTSGTKQPDLQLADVIAGRHDAYIRSFATDARAWGHPFFLRFNWEMNGNWFPWSEQVNGNRPGEYVKAWRHVHDLFQEVGATNATWVWCPNADPSREFQEISLLYPGDEYVDWTCLDGYNWGPGNPVVKGKPWRAFAEIFDLTYREIVERIAPSKPMVLGEFASSDYGGDKAGWIRDALIRIPAKYPQIRGLLWFNVNDRETHWPLEDSAAASEAFRTTIGSPVYLENEFGALAGGPIEPVRRRGTN